MQDLSRDSNNPKVATIEWLRWQGPLHWAFCLCLLIWIGLARQNLAASGIGDPNGAREANAQKELSQRLEDLIRQLRQERSAYYVQKTRYEGIIEKARDNRTVLRDQLEDLRREHTETDRQIRSYEAEVEGLKKQLVPRSSLEEVLDGYIQQFLAEQRTAIEEGIPYKQEERIARLEAVRVDANDMNSVDVADRLGQIWNYGQEELRLARSSETYSARAKSMDDALPHARFFRVGQKILGYTTEDGRQSAIWVSHPSHRDWLFITETKQSAQIRSAVEILDRRQGPRLVTLPIVLWPRSADKEGPDDSP